MTGAVTLQAGDNITIDDSAPGQIKMALYGFQGDSMIFQEKDAVYSGNLHRQPSIPLKHILSQNKKPGGLHEPSGFCNT